MNYRNYLGEVMSLEEIENYNENISSACFFSSISNEYLDWFGNWRELGDTTPIVATPNKVIDTAWLDE